MGENHYRRAGGLLWRAELYLRRKVNGERRAKSDAIACSYLIERPLRYPAELGHKETKSHSATFLSYVGAIVVAPNLFFAALPRTRDYGPSSVSENSSPLPNHKPQTSRSNIIIRAVTTTTTTATKAHQRPPRPRPLDVQQECTTGGAPKGLAKRPPGPHRQVHPLRLPPRAGRRGGRRAPRARDGVAGAGRRQRGLPDGWTARPRGAAGRVGGDGQLRTSQSVVARHGGKAPSTRLAWGQVGPSLTG